MAIIRLYRPGRMKTRQCDVPLLEWRSHHIAASTANPHTYSYTRTSTKYCASLSLRGGPAIAPTKYRHSTVSRFRVLASASACVCLPSRRALLILCIKASSLAPFSCAGCERDVSCSAPLWLLDCAHTLYSSNYTRTRTSTSTCT